MVPCRNCGQLIDETVKFCPHCGERANQFVEINGTAQNAAPAASNDSGSIGWGILGFFIPIVGLILFLVWKDSKPQSAKVAGIGALVGFIIGLISVMVL